MRIIIVLFVSLNLLFASDVFGFPLIGDWDLEDGIAAVLDPENDRGNIGDEAAGRDNSDFSSPGDAYYWSFDGLIRTENIIGALIDNGDGTAWRNTEIYRSGGTYTIHGDHLWNQPDGTIYKVSVNSHFTGKTYYEWEDNQWLWEKSEGSSHVNGKFNDDPFLFELTDHVVFDYYGYNDVVEHNIFFGKVTNVLMSISPVPEPATMLLFGVGLLGIAGVSRRRNK